MPEQLVYPPSDHEKTEAQCEEENGDHYCEQLQQEQDDPREKQKDEPDEYQSETYKGRQAPTVTQLPEKGIIPIPYRAEHPVGPDKYPPYISHTLATYPKLSHQPV